MISSTRRLRNGLQCRRSANPLQISSLSSHDHYWKLASHLIYDSNMVDFLSPKERSARMSRIKGKDTKPELSLRKILHRLGFRYRLHVNKLPGKPDLVFPKYNTVVFVHGCFWHRHPGCKVATTPKSNTEFWNDKFEKNKERDARTIKTLEDAGWNVLVVWECELDSMKKAVATGKLIGEKLKKPEKIGNHSCNNGTSS